ncbi:OmpA family protein [Seohaeicola saemankumensis]|nr:OmpA family protein [Seohaeicola saemankumensis]MCA0872591.1 OmpA family protein [Seohaeicola saemankumensis]
MSRTNRLATLLIAACLSAPVAVTAQNTGEMTAEEMAEAFKKQKTRGLVIVPSGDQGAATTDSATDTTTVAAAEEPAYSAVDKSEQVNIQIAFDFDSAALRDDQKPKLATLCQVMQSVDVAVFQIIGHTDSSGSAQYNERLSLLRAEEVKRHLVSDCGIADTRLKAIGMGESAPYNTADPRGDENRRVEFQALG